MIWWQELVSAAVYAVIAWATARYTTKKEVPKEVPKVLRRTNGEPTLPR